MGAGSLAHQERIEADVFHCDPSIFGPSTPCIDPAWDFMSDPFDHLFPFPIGAALRPSDFGQTAWFSSRGPNADGRSAPAVMADGTGVYGAGLGDADTVSLGRGTSFSAPNVAGIAALLSEAFPGASATQIRNALVKSGNKKVINDGSGKMDEGTGWVDALKAYELLDKGKVSDSLPRPPHTSDLVSQNIRGDGLHVRKGNVRTRINNLKPGEREDILYEVLPTYGQIEVAISDVSLKNNRCVPNLFFGDEIRLAIHTAKTSAIGPAGNYYNINPFSGSGHAFISPTDPDDAMLRESCPEPAGMARVHFSLRTQNPAWRASA